MGIIALLCFLGIIIGSYFIIGKKAPVPSSPKEEFKDIIKYLGKAKSTSDLIEAEYWFDEFLMFWEDELTEEQIKMYQNTFNESYNNKLMSI